MSRFQLRITHHTEEQKDTKPSTDDNIDLAEMLELLANTFLKKKFLIVDRHNTFI